MDLFQVFTSQIGKVQLRKKIVKVHYKKQNFNFLTEKKSIKTDVQAEKLRQFDDFFTGKRW